MGDSSTKATIRESTAAARKAMARAHRAAPERGPESQGRVDLRQMSGQHIEPGPDIVGLASAERGERSLAQAIASGIQATRRSTRADETSPHVATPRLTNVPQTRGAGAQSAPAPPVPVRGTSGPPTVLRRVPERRSVPPRLPARLTPIRRFAHFRPRSIGAEQPASRLRTRQPPGPDMRSPPARILRHRPASARCSPRE